MLSDPQISEPAPEKYSTARSTAGIAGLSVFSPAAGLAVEMAVAHRFGTSAAVDAFRIALAVVFLGQQFFVGLLFPNIIVPLFSECRAQGREIEAWRSAITLANLALVPTLMLTALLFARPSTVVWILAPGLAPQTHEWASFFVRWFSLSLVPFLYGGAALGLLYSQRIFWTATGAQLLYNVVLAGSILLAGGLLGPSICAVGVLAGASAFLLLQLARIAPLIPSVRASPRLHTVAERALVRKGARLSLPLLGSALINQANGIVAHWSLSAAPVGTIAALAYAGRLQRIASLLPDLLALVLFPKFSAIAHTASRDQLQELSTRALRMGLFIALPIGCVLFAMRVPLVALLFRHGAFSESATISVGLLFGLFLAGMPAGILSVYLANVLYALEDMWWPMFSSLASVGVAVAIMPAVATRFRGEGVALTIAGLYWIGALIKAAVLQWKYEAVNLGEVATSSLKIFPLAAAAAWLGSRAAPIASRLTGPGIVPLALELLVGASLAVVFYALATLMIGTPEALEFARNLRSQPLLGLNRMRGEFGG